MSTTLPMPSANPSDNDASQEMPILTVTRKKLPTGIASNVKQHVILVRDHSTSMSGSKIAELNQASDSLVRALADPANKDGFRVSVINFNDQASLLCLGEPAETLNLLPVSSSGGTHFVRALQETLDAVQAFKTQENPDGWHYLRPVVLFLSDGQSSIQQDVLDALHEEADVIAIAYGADAALDTLKLISSQDTVEVIGTDGYSLRQFLAQVGKTLSQSIQSNR